MTDNITREDRPGIGTPGIQSAQATGNRPETRGDREQGIQTTRDRGTRPLSRFGLFDRGAFGNTQAVMRHLAEDFDQLWQAFGFGTPGVTQTTGLRSVWAPQIEVQRKNGQLIVRADLPGVKANDVNVEIDEGVLAISGERKEEREEKEEGYYRTERSYGSFFRAIPLPEGVDESKVEAKYDNGVLEVRLPEPRQEQKRPKRVEVRRGSP